MLCLGIESTAHTFGASVVDEKGKVLSNEKDIFTTEEGGMIPFKAVEHHMNCFEKIIKDALKKADIRIRQIDLISFSQSPGLGHTLKVGAMTARSLSVHYDIPLIGVNHCIAHLEIGRMLTGCKDPVLLYASGANTQVISYEGGKYRIFGETLDIGIGNFLDSFARELGYGFPGGPKIYELSLKGKKFIKLPYCVKGMDVSFGGILTNVKNKIGRFSDENLCFSVQETVFAMLIEVAERAMAHCDKKELLLGGGVACNKRLQEMARLMCEDRSGKCFVPENQFLVDNAAMIAWLGIMQFNAGCRTSIEESGIDPYLRTDEINVNWR